MKESVSFIGSEFRLKESNTEPEKENSEKNRSEGNTDSC